MTGYEALVAVVAVIAFTIIALKKDEFAAGLNVAGKGSFFLRVKDPKRNRKPKRADSRGQLPSGSDKS
jgi:hypothetical protein